MSLALAWLSNEKLGPVIHTVLCSVICLFQLPFGKWILMRGHCGMSQEQTQKTQIVVLTKSMTMTLSTSMSQKKLYSLGSRYIHFKKDRLYNLWNYSYKIDMKTSQLVKGLYIHGEYFIFTKQNCILSFFSPGSQTNTFSYLEVRVGDTNANSLSINAGAWKMCSNKLCFTYDESKSSKKVCIFPAFAK